MPENSSRIRTPTAARVSAQTECEYVKHGDQMTVDAFQIVFYEMLHSHDVKFPGDIGQFLHAPAAIADYKLGVNCHYLVRHLRGNVLIVLNANYVSDLFNDGRADVVFLGIGGLGKQPEDFTRTSGTKR